MMKVERSVILHNQIENWPYALLFLMLLSACESWFMNMAVRVENWKRGRMEDEIYWKINFVKSWMHDKMGIILIKRMDVWRTTNSMPLFREHPRTVLDRPTKLETFKNQQAFSNEIPHYLPTHRWVGPSSWSGTLISDPKSTTYYTHNEAYQSWRIYGFWVTFLLDISQKNA